MIQLINTISLLLEQTQRQKDQTVISVALFALVAVLFIMDIFAKNKFGSGKILKKMILFLSFMAIIVYIAVMVFYR